MDVWMPGRHLLQSTLASGNTDLQALLAGCLGQVIMPRRGLCCRWAGTHQARAGRCGAAPGRLAIVAYGNRCHHSQGVDGLLWAGTR